MPAHFTRKERKAISEISTNDRRETKTDHWPGDSADQSANYQTFLRQSQAALENYHYVKEERYKGLIQTLFESLFIIKDIIYGLISLTLSLIGLLMFYPVELLFNILYVLEIIAQKLILDPAKATFQTITGKQKKTD